MPLYIFEPRYRQMTEAALRGNRLIGMATTKPDPIGSMILEPELYPVGSAGVIETFERRKDGTFDITLEGMFRFEIEQELEKPDGQLFRSARVKVLDDADSDVDAAEVERLRSEVHRNYGALLARVAPQFLDEFHTTAFDSIPDDVYANTVSLSLDIDPIEKQSLLTSPSTRARLERVLAVLVFELADEPMRRPSNRPTIQ